MPLNIFSITCDISQNLSSCTPNQMCDSLILFHPSDVIRKAYEQKGTFLKKGFCFMNLISLRTFKKSIKGGALESQKEPTVDRSFLVKHGKQKWRFSLHNRTLQNSSKMERFLNGTKKSTFFLLLAYGAARLDVHLFHQPFLNTFLDNETIIGGHSR